MDEVLRGVVFLLRKNINWVENVMRVRNDATIMKMLRGRVMISHAGEYEIHQRYCTISE